MTFEEYLEFEEASETRHEFVNGYAFPMHPTARSGGTRRHSKIISNVAGQLWLRTRGTRCESHSQGSKLRTPGGDTYYPDVMVSCGPPPSDDDLYLDDPCLAVEVLSPSTERTDFSDKLESYTELPRSARTSSPRPPGAPSTATTGTPTAPGSASWSRGRTPSSRSPAPRAACSRSTRSTRASACPPAPPSRPRPRLRRIREGGPAEAYSAEPGAADDGAEAGRA